MSFDIGSAVDTPSSSTAVIYGRPASGSVNFEDEEPPLLYKLGIQPNQIWKKAKSILDVFRASRIYQPFLEEASLKQRQYQTQKNGKKDDAWTWVASRSPIGQQRKKCLLQIAHRNFKDQRGSCWHEFNT